jgi:cytochrome c oxidase cbb3-type subunit 3
MPPPPATAGASGVLPGIHPSVVLGVLTNPHAGDAATATEGRQLFVWYNCSGCHGGRAGGGMGPNLRDSTQRKYGNNDTQLYSTIAEGRPAGMPAWGAKLPKDQIWKLITYIRTLSTPQEPDRVTVPQPGE